MEENLMIQQKGSESSGVEVWKLEFVHRVFRPAEPDPPRPGVRVGVMLDAVLQTDEPDLRRSVCVASASFLPGEKPDMGHMTVREAGEAMLTALVQQGFGSLKNGCLDVSGFYDKYMTEHELAAMRSPVSHVFGCQGPGADVNGWMYCRIGGIGQKPVRAGVTGRDMLRAAEYYPACRFQLTEYAAELYQQQLALYAQAGKRVTDYTIYEYKGKFLMRCRIDGVQQMAKEVDRPDMSYYIFYKDFFALAAKYYAGGLSGGMERSRSLGL